MTEDELIAELTKLRTRGVSFRHLAVVATVTFGRRLTESQVRARFHGRDPLPTPEYRTRAARTMNATLRAAA